MREEFDLLTHTANIRSKFGKEWEKTPETVGALASITEPLNQLSNTAPWKHCCALLCQVQRGERIVSLFQTGPGQAIL